MYHEDAEERSKPGNLKGRSLAVTAEQKRGAWCQEGVRPWVWSEWRWVRKYASLPSAQRSTEINRFSILVETSESEREGLDFGLVVTWFAFFYFFIFFLLFSEF